MRFRIPAVAAVFAAAVFAAGSTAARADVTLKVDSVHSMAVFRIAHFGASQPFGVFHGLEGTIVADSGTAPPSSLAVTAPVARLDMGNPKWEQDIKAADWFNAAQFPDITFKSTSIKSTGDDTFDATGDLTLHGVTKSITVPMKRMGIGQGMQGETRIGYDAEFKISRKEFGMAKYDGPIGDEVTLMINIEGVEQK
jgi:polyisoprenoid-binding protein YceI